MYAFVNTLCAINKEVLNLTGQTTMEIDITYLMTEDVSQFSASIAETGRTNEGAITWNNAISETLKNKPGRITKFGLKRLCNDSKAIVDYFEEFGAWTRKELIKMGITRLNALLLQYISGNLREMEDLKDDSQAFGMDWAAIEEQSQAGQISGSIYLADDNKAVYFSMCN